MSKCHHCQVEILDDTETCPLCRGVLEIGETSDQSYPDISSQRKKLLLIRRMAAFLSLVAGAICLFIDYHTANGLGWSLIAAAGIMLGLTVFSVMTNPIAGYRKRILVTLFGAVVYVIFIDIMNGFPGWSVNYVLPGAIFLTNFVLIFLMIYNRRNWQSYMIYQIGGIIVGAIPIVLIYAGVVTMPILSELAFGSSVFLFIGTLLFGGHIAKQELQRRFYI